MKTTFVVIALAVSALASEVQASVNGRRNTALGLGAITIYELATGKTTNGVIAGVGTAYAYQRYKGARNAQRRQRYRYLILAPPGWHHGQKRGWHGAPVPPGQRRR